LVDFFLFYQQDVLKLNIFIFSSETFKILLNLDQMANFLGWLKNLPKIWQNFALAFGVVGKIQ
jgi:hypothetical protein